MNNIIQNSKFKTQNYNSKFKIDLKKKCFDFSLSIIDLTNSFPNKRSAWVISDQLLRSATSIGANLVEARVSSSRLEFKKFYEIALKSANETFYWLELVRESNLVSHDKADVLLEEVDEISRMIAGGVIKLKQKTF